MEYTGHHGLSCRRSGGRISRHQSANETIRRALVSGGIPAVLEPVGIAREDGKRPDGMSLILWDFTCSDTMALSHRNQATSGPGEVACTAESLKMRKYSSLTSTYSFAPICIETMGAWGEGAKCIIKKIGQRVRWATGKSRSTVFLIQRLAIGVQRGNVASIMATIPSSRDWGEISNLPPI